MLKDVSRAMHSTCYSFPYAVVVSHTCIEFVSMYFLPIKFYVPVHTESDNKDLMVR